MLNRILILLTWLAFSALPARGDDLLVFAAASLKEPLDEIAATYGGVTVSYGGSGTLARQVMAGAPADVVILAHDSWIDAVEEAGFLVVPPVDLLSNRLVLIAPSGGSSVALTPESLTNALGPSGRIAMGRRDAVPAGIYGKAALVQLDLWPGVTDQLAEVDNVRAVLALVARAEAPLGIVYATDARVSDAVGIVATFPADAHPPIRYTAGQITAQASDFMTYLAGDAALTIFETAGFLAPVGTP